MSDEDYLLALQLQKEWNQEADRQLKVTRENHNLNTSAERPKTSVVDPEWEITDPNPDIHSLFGVFNVRFFWNALGAVEVKWSPRMYTCAGICTYKGRAGCIVSLSLPLLKFRPRKDLIETLLHEMIHAYLFVTKNNKDRVSHGSEFCKHMNRINKEAGTRITIYHSFHDEVNHYKTHVWRCNGKCQADPPFFGYVRRAINRAPAPSDFWFDDHVRKCGGTFRKVSEPDNFKSRQNKKAVDSQKSITSSAKKQKDLKNFFSSTPNSTPERNFGKTATSTTPSVKPFVSLSSGVAVHPVQPNENLSDGLVKHGGVKSNIVGFGNLSGGAPSTSVKSEEKDNFAVPTVPFSGKGYVLGSSGSNDRTRSRLLGDAEPIQMSETLPSLSSTSISDKKQKVEVVYTEDLTNLDFSEDFDSSVTDLTSKDSSDEEELSDLKCPVCCERLNKNVSINEHLDECPLLEKVVNSSRHDTLSDSSDSDDNKPTGLDGTLSDDDMSVDSPVPIAGPFVDCPNCNSRVEESIINQHLDQCLTIE